LEFSWAEGKLTSLKILSKAGYPLSIRYKDKTFSFPTKKGEIFRFNGDLIKI
jgi:hypothetical protein